MTPVREHVQRAASDMSLFAAQLPGQQASLARYTPKMGDFAQFLESCLVDVDVARVQAPSSIVSDYAHVVLAAWEAAVFLLLACRVSGMLESTLTDAQKLRQQMRT